MFEFFQGVGGGLAEALRNRRMVVDHVSDVLDSGAELDRQRGEVDDLRGILAGDVGADEAACPPSKMSLKNPVTFESRQERTRSL